jgi:hypothetical protein
MDNYIEFAQTWLHGHATNGIHRLHLFLHHPETSYWTLLEHAFVAFVLLRIAIAFLFPREGTMSAIPPFSSF